MRAVIFQPPASFSAPPSLLPPSLLQTPRMVVPPGYGVGDIIAIANLGVQAWKVYKKCKAALEIFRNISTEVLSMHDVLKEVEEALVIIHILSRSRSLMA